MHDLLFAHQGQLEYDNLIGDAAKLDLDLDQFTGALADTELGERVCEDAASAYASGVRGTPTFFIGNRRHLGPWDSRTL
jgi:protein-disulfide isomerase